MSLDNKNFPRSSCKVALVAYVFVLLSFSTTSNAEQTKKTNPSPPDLYDFTLEELMNINLEAKEKKKA